MNLQERISKKLAHPPVGPCPNFVRISSHSRARTKAASTGRVRSTGIPMNGSQTPKKFARRLMTKRQKNQHKPNPKTRKKGPSTLLYGLERAPRRLCQNQ